MENKQITVLNVSQQELAEIVQTAVVQAFCHVNDKIQSNETKWLTRQQAAIHLSISLPTLDKLTRLEALPVHRTGRRKLYNAEELNNAVKNIKIKYK